MMLAVARLVDADSNRFLGTAFAVTRRLALTAFHCVGDQDGVWAGRLRCVWLYGAPEASSGASVLDYDLANDVALLSLESAVPRSLYPIPLTAEVKSHGRFIAPGVVGALRELPLVAMSGEIVWPNGRLPHGADVIQLTCAQAAVGLPMHGLSGAPVLTGTPERAIGVVCQNPPRDNDLSLSAGAILFAAPAGSLMQRWPELAPSADTVELTRRLTDSKRTLESVTAAVQALLASGRIGLEQRELAELPVLLGEGVMFAADRGRAIIRVVKDSANLQAVSVAIEDLSEAVKARQDQTGQSYVALITDGARWSLYQVLRDQCILVEEKLASARDASGLTGWIEAIASTAKNILPSRQEIGRALGADSPGHKLDEAELAYLYAAHRELPTVRVKRRMWAKLLTTASGTGFADNDSLFINHTLLVMMAKLIGHGVLGVQPEPGRISAAALMSGEAFADAEIEGVIESDFFDWVVEVPGGDRFIMNVARRLNRFDWGSVKHDVLKLLYESIISKQIRRSLGEYYTPDWLAEKIISETVTDPLSQRVLDASCGSGTFLFHAIKAYLEAAEESGLTNADAVRGLVTKVIGIDVQPVAVTLARITYLLAIGSRHLKSRPAFSVPVYLGDSMRWGKNSIRS